MLALLCQHVRGLQVWGERCGLAAGVRQAQPCCCTCAGRCGMAIGLATGRQALHSGVCRTWLSNKPTQRHTARLPPVGDSRSEACRCAGARRPESGTHLRHNLTRHGDRACHLKSDHVPATSRLCSCDTPCKLAMGDSGPMFGRPAEQQHRRLADSSLPAVQGLARAGHLGGLRPAPQDAPPRCSPTAWPQC